MTVCKLGDDDYDDDFRRSGRKLGCVAERPNQNTPQASVLILSEDSPSKIIFDIICLPFLHIFHT
jgi:hypothetical protein